MNCAVDLQVVQYRPQMLYARRQARKFAPISILVGFAFWEGGIFLACSNANWSLVLAMALGSLGFFSMAPLMVMFGAWLSIDQMRGWIHYRLSGWRGRTQESFSPQRIDSLRVRRCGFFGRSLFGCWKLVLKLDHPRLGNVCLMRSRDRRRIEQVAGDLSALLETDWYDSEGEMHRDDPLLMRMPMGLFNIHRNILPPPPEIEIHARQGGTTLVLPHPSEITHDLAMALFYAFVWCLWAWTSLSLEVWELTGGGLLQTRQYAILSLLVMASLTGGFMLARALYRMVSQEELQATVKGWILIRRCLGMPLASRGLSPSGIKGMRRIEPPNRQVGLWIGNEHDDVRLGAGLSVEALYWVQAMLRNDPQARHAYRPAVAEAPLNADLESDPGKLIQPSVRTGG